MDRPLASVDAAFGPLKHAKPDHGNAENGRSAPQVLREADLPIRSSDFPPL